MNRRAFERRVRRKSRTTFFGRRVVLTVRLPPGTVPVPPSYPERVKEWGTQHYAGAWAQERDDGSVVYRSIGRVRNAQGSRWVLTERVGTHDLPKKIEAVDISAENQDVIDAHIAREAWRDRYEVGMLPDGVYEGETLVDGFRSFWSKAFRVSSNAQGVEVYVTIKPMHLKKFSADLFRGIRAAKKQGIQVKPRIW